MSASHATHPAHPTTYERMAAALADEFGIEREAIAPDATFEELGVDSLMLLEMFLTIQEHLRDAPEGIGLDSTLAEAAERLDAAVAAAAATAATRA
jgi:acyl carrier protein